MIKISMMARGKDQGEYAGLVKHGKEIGLDAIDIHMDRHINREPKFMATLKKQCLDAGLPIGYFSSGHSMVGPAEQRQARIAQAKSDVDGASVMGAQLCHAFARHNWPAKEEEQEKFWGPMIEDFQATADYAAEKGVVLGLQNHNHGSFAMNANQVLRILRETGRKNLTYIMDCGQWQGSIGGSPRGWTDTSVDIYDHYMKRVAPYATCVRAKIYKIDNGWEEWIDYPRVFKMLQAVDFNGNVSMVFEGGDPPRNRYSKEECLKIAVPYLREVIKRSDDRGGRV
ncbi:MAG: sugar phosphate isomerase/epimerase [SAR202 cluster bacterium]|nr:sugar phosphate isomerase/epimerase [SAR202 cluster bacterium]